MPIRPFVALILGALIAIGVPAFTQNGQRAVLISQYTWNFKDEAFGGFSGLELARDGTGLTVISDRGTIWTGKVLRRGDKISGVSDLKGRKILNNKGVPLTRFQKDSEGLAIAEDGTLYISFEGIHRVWKYAAPAGKAVGLRGHPDFKTMQNNSSLEALAIDAKGRLYTLPERSGAIDRAFPVYRYDGKRWTKPFSIPRKPPYLPTGADFGPDGKLYLLERDFSGIFGFSTRVRRFEIENDVIIAEDTLLETRTGTHDNLEGISVWRDKVGSIRMTMVSDDNFGAFQRTELVEYRVTE